MRISGSCEAVHGRGRVVPLLRRCRRLPPRRGLAWPCRRAGGRASIGVHGGSVTFDRLTRSGAPTDSMGGCRRSSPRRTSFTRSGWTRHLPARGDPEHAWFFFGVPPCSRLQEWPPIPIVTTNPVDQLPPPCPRPQGAGAVNGDSRWKAVFQMLGGEPPFPRTSQYSGPWEYRHRGGADGEGGFAPLPCLYSIRFFS